MQRNRRHTDGDLAHSILEIMKASGRPHRSLWSTMVLRLRGLRVSALLSPERLRVGITMRLATAFGAVAALALAANFIVERGVLIERITRITRIVERPVAANRSTGMPVSPPAPPRVVSLDALRLAVERFGRAVPERVATNSDPTQGEYQQASIELELSDSSSVAQVRALSAKSAADIDSKVRAYLDQGDALVQMANQRHQSMVEYSTLVEHLGARVQHSLDGAWKILGHVVARQSLIQLSADLDQLRRSSAALGSVSIYSGPDIDRLLHDEQQVNDNLDANERGYSRSEGAQWFQDMREDMAHLLSVRASLLRMAQDLSTQTIQFAQDGVDLAASIPRRIEAPALVSAFTSPRPTGGATVAPTALAPVADIAPAIETSSVSVPVADDHRRVIIAWLSATTLALLLYISLVTVLSIVRPVRHMIRALALLAKGDNTVRVERGGMKELDTLAGAFNAMADELAQAKSVARDYQLGLERMVADRTRQLQELAENDPLTGLPNRRQLFVLLDAALARAHQSGYLVGVFFLDIDNFKYINDSMGHAFGDRVLVSLSQRLSDVAHTIGFAARLGGDEMTVVLDRAASLDEIRAAGQALTQAFQTPLSVEGRDLIVSVSVGASVYPEHATESEALLQAADAALFRAKSLGRSQLSVFTPDLLEAAAAKFSTEQGLRRAFERGEFELMFQPEVSAETLKCTLVEALVRWRMPDRTLALPAHFLGIAEESGLIIDIGHWVLKSAIETAAAWHHGDWPEARVAINVSPRQLFDPHFVDRLLELLQIHRLPAHCIEMELTESVLQTGPATLEALQRLRGHGVAIALDDFGTGYSSLASLEQLPLSRIKLDRTLIAGIDVSARSASISQAITSMCQGLGLAVTAEGVERPEQFARLLGERSMCMQGYLLSEPLPGAELIESLPRLSARCQDLLLACRATGADDGSHRARGERSHLSEVG